MPDHPGEFSSRSKLRESQRLGLLQDPVYPRLLALHNLDPTDADLIELLREGLESAQEKEILDPNPFRAELPNINGVFDGELYLGLALESGITWSVPNEQLMEHMLVVGRSGGGKTNLILLIVAGLLCQFHQ